MLRRILGRKRMKLQEDGENYNEELNVLYLSPNIIRVVKSRVWAGHVAHMEEMKSAYTILVRKYEENTTAETQVGQMGV
jgi:hypothetical protein